MQYILGFGEDSFTSKILESRHLLWAFSQYYYERNFLAFIKLSVELLIFKHVFYHKISS